MTKITTSLSCQGQSVTDGTSAKRNMSRKARVSRCHGGRRSILSLNNLFRNKTKHAQVNDDEKLRGNQTHQAPQGGLNQNSIDITTTTTSISACPNDLQVHILSFLAESDIRCVMQVDRHFHELLHTYRGYHLWTLLARQRWPFLAPSFHGSTDEKVPLWKTLLHAGRDKAAFPTELQKSLFPRDIVAFRNHENDDDDKALIVRFIGTVGVSSQSVRANHPLPRPVLGHATPKPFTGKRKLFGSRKPSKSSQKAPKWQPFVVPFVRQPNGSRNKTYCFVPRTISYFEVNLGGDERDNHPELFSTERRRDPCVAVGLSTASFPYQTHMPGWEPNSFGYHSDDGSAFGNANLNMMKEHYGPTFGTVGNVVGCGIDYYSKAVFYTLNGLFLGYAHTLTDEQTQQDWFPCIGLDSHVTVECNFGTQRPFCFDLASMVMLNKSNQA